MYVDDLESGRMVSNEEPSIVKETTATALVDGNNVSGTAIIPGNNWK